MARQRTYAPSNYSSSTAKSFSGGAATKSAQDNRSAYNREKARSTNYNSQPKTSTFKQSKKKATDAVGRSNLDNLKVAKVPVGVPFSTILNAGQTLRQKTLDKNVEYFKGLKSRNPNLKYDLTDTGYKSYMKDRLDGKITASGNVNPGYGRDRDNNVQTQKVTAGGQTILTKEKTPAETKVAEEKKEYDARQTKKKGRRKNVLTSSQGVMKTSADYSLGKKSLLGQVV